MDQIKLLEDRLVAEMDEQEQAHLQKVIAFRRSAEAAELTEAYKKTYPADYIERASAYFKVISLGYEDTPAEMLRGPVMARLAARWGWGALSPRSPLETRGDDRQRSGLIDRGCQSARLFPDFTAGDRSLTGWQRHQAGIVGTEMRNRYRRVYWLTTGQERVDYFNLLREQGLGTAEHPVLIASIGEGPGSLEMDIQQELKERYDIATRIVLFNAGNEARKLGSFFARMRGADLVWAVNFPDPNEPRSWEKRVREPLAAVGPQGEAITVVPEQESAFHHLIMNGWSEHCNDQQLAGWLKVAGLLLATEARAVVTLMRSTYQDKTGQEKPLYVFKASDQPAGDQGRLFFRTIPGLEQSGLAEKEGLTVKDQVDGALYPAVSLEKV